MNHLAYVTCWIGFLVFPSILLVFRWRHPKRCSWLLVFVLAGVLGWLLTNGCVYFFFKHLGDQISGYLGDPPEELVERWANDGAKRVFALIFGWAYGLVWLAPHLLVYAAASAIRVRFARAASQSSTTS
jgi:hypothetical protein